MRERKGLVLMSKNESSCEIEREGDNGSGEWERKSIKKEKKKKLCIKPAQKISTFNPLIDMKDWPHLLFKHCNVVILALVTISLVCCV